MAPWLPPSPAWTSRPPRSGRRSAPRRPRTRSGSPRPCSACLRSLADVTDGFATDQLTHGLQTATLAEQAGADQEVIVASLCHDIGKAISVPNHPEIAAAILKLPRAPRGHDMIRVHQDFQGRHYYHHFGGDPDAREKHRDSSARETFTLAERFADEWDQVAFDPTARRTPSSTSEPMVREVFAQAKLF